MITRKLAVFVGSSNIANRVVETAEFRDLLLLQEESVIQQRWQETLKKSSKQPPGQIELDHYLTTLESARENADVLQYWVDLQLQYPLLSKLAVDTLVIPASSAPVERVFSTAGDSCVGRRNRLTDVNLEREVLIKRNHHYL